MLPRAPTPISLRLKRNILPPNYLKEPTYRYKDVFSFSVRVAQMPLFFAYDETAEEEPTDLHPPKPSLLARNSLAKSSDKIAGVANWLLSSLQGLCSIELIIPHCILITASRRSESVGLRAKSEYYVIANLKK
jgi:hypothetical protein